MKIENNEGKRDTPPTVDDILRGSSHALTVFKPEAVAKLPIFLKRGKPYLKCQVTGQDRSAFLSIVGDTESGPKRDILGRASTGIRADHYLNFPA